VTPIAKEAKLPKKVNNQIVTLAFTIALIMAGFGTVIAIALLYFVKKMRWDKSHIFVELKNFPLPFYITKSPFLSYFI